MAARIQTAIASLDPEPAGHISHEGIKHRALPLFGTLGEVWLLRPDGSLWRADTEAGLSLEPLPEHLRVIALVAGTERYPWLKAILPKRPSRSADCEECSGSGRLGREQKVFCYRCFALGWLAEGDS
ncbi:MAG: hypothetical protein AAF997_09710 [Myxococcota bacterium]